MGRSAEVLVDTSVWIDFFNGEKHAVENLEGLMKADRVVICGQILQEVLQGARDEKAFRKLAKEMRLWRTEAEQPEDFEEAARIFARLRWKGVTIPPTDCLIAGVALRRDLSLYAHDADFEAVSGLNLFSLAPPTPPPRSKR